MTERSNVCLVGCGWIGGLHAKNLSKTTDLSYCSRRRESAEAFLQKYGGKRTFVRFEDVLGAGEIDAVVLATPPELHKDQITAALAAGVDVLVEKPMCITKEEVAAIRESSADSSAFLMVAENYYYKGVVSYIKAVLAEGEIGALRTITAKKLTQQHPKGWKSSLGALLEGGIHFVALISDIVGQAPERVIGEFPGSSGAEPERHSRTRLEYADGTTAQLEYSWSTPSLAKGLFQHSRVEGEAGHIVFESNGLYAWTNSADAGPSLYLPVRGDLLGYREMTRDFVGCLRDRSRQPYSDFNRAHRELEIIFKSYEGLRESSNDE